jgi:hypothetical protein
MISIPADQFMLLMAITLFILGLLSIIIGITILVTRTASKEVRTLATQTTRLAQKGLSDDIVGLVGNTSALLEALNALVRTTAGIGVFITIVGLLMMVASGWFVYQLYSI